MHRHAATPLLVVLLSLLAGHALAAQAAPAPPTPSSAATALSASGRPWDLTVGAASGPSLWTGPMIAGRGSAGALALGLTWWRTTHWGARVEAMITGRTTELSVASDVSDTKLTSNGGSLAFLVRRFFSPRTAGMQLWVDAGLTLHEASCEVTYAEFSEVFGAGFVGGGPIVERCATWQPTADTPAIFTPVDARVDAHVGARIGAGMDGRRFGLWVSAEPLAHPVARTTTRTIRARAVLFGVQYHLLRR